MKTSKGRADKRTQLIEVKIRHKNKFYKILEANIEFYFVKLALGGGRLDSLSYSYLRTERSALQASKTKGIRSDRH